MEPTPCAVDECESPATSRPRVKTAPGQWLEPEGCDTCDGHVSQIRELVEASGKVPEGVSLDGLQVIPIPKPRKRALQ